MIGFILKSVAMAFGIATGIFTFVPEAFFGKYEWVTQTTLEQYKWFAFCDAQDINIIISRLVCFLYVEWNVVVIWSIPEISKMDYN